MSIGIRPMRVGEEDADCRHGANNCRSDLGIAHFVPKLTGRNPAFKAKGHCAGDRRRQMPGCCWGPACVSGCTIFSTWRGARAGTVCLLTSFVMATYARGGKIGERAFARSWPSREAACAWALTFIKLEVDIEQRRVGRSLLQACWALTSRSGSHHTLSFWKQDGFGQTSLKGQTDMTIKTVGLIGVQASWATALARTCLEKGFRPCHVMAHRNREPVDDLLKRGCHRNSNLRPRSLKCQSDMVILCVTGTPQVEANGLWPEFGHSGRQPKRVWSIADCSTAIP